MALTLIKELLTGDSPQMRDIVRNEAILVGFLTLAKGIDDLQDISIRFYEESRSLYQVTSSGRTVDDLVAVLSDFFDKPAKAAGKSLPVALRFHPAVKYLGGIRKDQVLFLKKLKTGFFYGALWPWQQDQQKIEIHLGFCSPEMSDQDYDQLATLVKKFLSRKKIEAVSGVGGQIHGISLPSFLQMSEMEGATYTLNVSSGGRCGYLHLDSGSLIAAQYEGLTGSEAAYRIISWDNAAIQIEAADPDRVREIQEPLMHVMMESLKIKDEAGESPPPPPAPPASPAPRQPSAETKPTSEPPADTPAALSNEPPDPPEEDGAEDASDTPVIKPFEKVTDHSADKQRRMRRGVKLLVGLGLSLIVVAAAVGGVNLLKQRQINHRYEQLMADLASAKALDAQIVLLLQYLKANPHDAHRAQLEARLQETTSEIEKRDYEKTLADVGRLSVDENYEDKALSLYTAFLSKHPQSPYAEEVNAAVGTIRQTLASAYFDALKVIAESDPAARFAACRDYLERFPKGAERASVKRMILDLAEADWHKIEKQAAACDARREWDDCIAQCDRFIATYGDHFTLENANRLRDTLQDKKEFTDLAIQAELAGDDRVRAKAIYADYLAKRPQTTQKEAIARRIETLDAELAQKAAWDKTAAYARDRSKDIFSRLQHVEAYLQSHPPSVYAALAEGLLKELAPERQAALEAQERAEAQRRQQARRKVVQDRQAQEARRIRSLREQVAGALSAAADRFLDHGDGTVTDRYTGLTWSLLDSYLELGQCISYKAAKNYVQGLDTGSHADWRLPTAGELAAIYKNSPFFPDSGADWYWTSEYFVRGYHHVVDVVTSTPETVFSRSSKSENDCGSVRAVRR